MRFVCASQVQVHVHRDLGWPLRLKPGSGRLSYGSLRVSQSKRSRLKSYNVASTGSPRRLLSYLMQIPHSYSLRFCKEIQMYKTLTPAGDGCVAPQDGIKFSDTSDSSVYQPQPPTGGGYFDQLDRQRCAIISITEEQLCPPSRPTSPGFDTRVDSLRQKVVEAWALAGGEPSNGKWGVIARLLRTGCTTGNYVIEPVRFEKALSKRRRFLKLPDTEDEWFELEQQSTLKSDRDNALHRKIEIWQADVMPNASDINTVTSAHEGVLSNAYSQGSAKLSKKSSQLGFPVVKASSNLTSSKKKGSGKSSKFFPPEETRHLPILSSAPRPTTAIQSDRPDKSMIGAYKRKSKSNSNRVLRIQQPDDLSDMVRSDLLSVHERC
jgi:hypothetical protein